MVPTRALHLLVPATLLGPVGTALAGDVLVFDDTSPSSAMSACTRAGHGCTQVSIAQDFADQAAAGWDIVVVDTARIWFGDSGGEAALLDLLDAGVPVVFHSGLMDTHAAYLVNLGVEFGGSSGQARTVYQDGPVLFSSGVLPESVPTPLTGENVGQVMCYEVPPHASDPTAEEVAIYDTVASTAVAATISQGGRVLVLGFSSDEYAAADADSDGTPDVVELLVNAMHAVTSCFSLDADGDGFSACDGDCDDSDGTIAPGEVDVPGDGVDQNCDGQDATDGDGDGHAPTSDGGDDCDDADAGVHPGASEVANGIDDDCDGAVDEGTTVTDDDADGYCEGPDPCIDGSVPGDCDDTDRDRSPDATEACHDTIDNDCDGDTDGVDTDCGGDGSDDDSAADDDTSGADGPQDVGGCQCGSAGGTPAGAAIAGLLLSLSASRIAARRRRAA